MRKYVNLASGHCPFYYKGSMDGRLEVYVYDGHLHGILHKLSLFVINIFFMRSSGFPDGRTIRVYFSNGLS
jgi:hypothetical protein